MPASPTLNRTTFLLDQPLFRLAESDAEARWQAVINEAEPRDDQRSKANFTPAFRPPSADGSPEHQPTWERLDRELLIKSLANPTEEWRRGALVCGAGLGKTTNLDWIETAINRHVQHQGRQLAFFLELRNLTDSADALMDSLLKKMNDKLAGRQALRLAPDLERRRQEGRITLLLDSLDQAGAGPKGHAMTALRCLLGSAWSNCPIWVSGRPHAFKPNRSLFDSPVGFPWQFLRVGQLDEPECRFLLEDARARTERRRHRS